MKEAEVAASSTTEGLPIASSMGPVLEATQIPPHSTLIGRRAAALCGLAIALAAAAAMVAQMLKRLIWLITNLSFYQHFSASPATPWAHHLGWLVIVVPIIGGAIVGIMARYGSSAIRGHGIPEAMEQVLTNRSRIPSRLTWLKPLSAAIAIGTGGPFGAEGPIIATGGALGSFVGQVLPVSPHERKVLLAVGAASGMAATFGSPVSAVLLAIELLLFEYRPQSIIPVALGTATAAGIRMMFEGAAPVFAMPDLAQPTGLALVLYVVVGAIVGICSVFVTRAVYVVEDAFEHLPVHWMWWPAIGGLAVGLVGVFAPRTLGVGYENIADIISNHLVLGSVAFLSTMKFLSWVISLGSGTSGGTLAPLFTIGGGIGLLIGAAMQHLVPSAALDLRIAALVGMAAVFAGASRALLASVIFAFETTLQPLGLLPLLGGCTAAYFVSCLLMRQTIMTEKIARRGVRVPSEYTADFLDSIRVDQVATKPVVTIQADMRLKDVREWLASAFADSKHQGFPVVDTNSRLLGVLTRRDLMHGDRSESTAGSVIHRPSVVVYADATLREATEHMVKHDVGRLPVLARENAQLIGIITRSDILAAHRRRLDEHRPE